MVCVCLAAPGAAVPPGPSTAPPAPASAGPLVPAPHPLITEVLFAVPTGPKGDANADGTRDAAGDEFIELFNPHAAPIELGGYRLTDRSAQAKDRMAFTFPPCRLEPGGVAVVFNGFKSAIPGAVGDARAAPTMPNDRFAGALVFTMNNQKARIGLANGGDMVVLTSPAGAAVAVVHWGTFDEPLPAAPLSEAGPASAKGSIGRESARGGFIAHDALGVPFSPGAFPYVPGRGGGAGADAPEPSAPPSAPAVSPAPARPSPKTPAPK